MTQHLSQRMSPSAIGRPSPSSTARTSRGLRVLTTAIATLGLATLAACSGGAYPETQLPTKTVPSSTSPAPATKPPECNPLQSYDPLPSLPARGDISDSRVVQILDRGQLVVGISADTYLFGARNAFTNQIEGFDIDVAKAVAKSLFGEDGHLQLRVITAADRLTLLQDGSLDMVARNMTMNCDRWSKIAFSAEYYRSGQKVLVAKGAKEQSLEDLAAADKTVCAPTGTSSLDKLKTVTGIKIVTAENHTGCLVLFQQGKADAITGDDTVLAGLAAQDPYTQVTDAAAITQEPYGLGFNKDNVYLARYVNRLLADMKADGRWKAIYDRWLAAPLGPAPKPPTSVYGRR